MTQVAEYGGTECVGPVESIACSELECTDFVVGPWGDWFGCSSTSGVGTSSRTRQRIVVKPSAGVALAAGPAETTLTETSECSSEAPSSIMFNSMIPIDVKWRSMPPTTVVPSLMPSLSPSAEPSLQPSTMPSPQPTLSPSNLKDLDSLRPSLSPSKVPSKYPSVRPSRVPSVSPSIEPSTAPAAFGADLVADFNKATSIFITLDTTPEQLTADVVQQWKKVLLEKAIETGQVTSIDIDIFPGSVILHVSFRGRSGALDQTAAEQLLNSLGKKELLVHTSRTGEGTTVLTVTRSMPVWTAWLDMDDPTTGDGDEELTSHYSEAFIKICEPLDVHCTTVDGVHWELTGERLDIPCSLPLGIRCLNRTNPSGCSDYRIRLACKNEPQSAAPQSAAPSSRPTLQPTATADPTAEPTLQPVISSGSGRCICSGDCSGHGRCYRSGTECLCECKPGWYRRDCSSFALEASINGSTTECEGKVPAPTSALVPGNQELYCSEQRSGWNSQQTTLKVSVKPDYTLEGPIQCQLASSSSAEVEIVNKENQALRFAPADSGPKFAALQGVADAEDDGDQAFTISVGCFGQDRTLDTARTDATSINKNVNFPIISSVFPTTVTRIGTQISVRGRDFGSEFDLHVGGVKVGLF